MCRYAKGDPIDMTGVLASISLQLTSVGDHARAVIARLLVATPA